MTAPMKNDTAAWYAGYRTGRRGDAIGNKNLPNEFMRGRQVGFRHTREIAAKRDTHHFAVWFDGTIRWQPKRRRGV